MTERYDLVVIGSGPAGEKAAAQAAYFGKRVCVIEKEKQPGGAAVHTGTLPSKTLRETAIYLSGHRSRALYGISVELTDRHAAVPHLIKRKDAIADAESRRIRNNLERHDVTFLEGHARFSAEHEVTVTTAGGKAVVEGDFFLVATGSKPYRPPDIDFASDLIYDSDEILGLAHLPSSMIVLGAGVIGSEYACMFAALGVDVTMVDARDEILPFLDHEIIQRLKTAMTHLGIKLVQGTRWGKTAAREGRVDVELSSGETISAETLLFAAGRGGNTGDLGLDIVGLVPNKRGHLEVNDQYQTTKPHVYAAGDVIGFPALASTSMEQGRVAMCHAFGFTYKQAVHPMLPYGIYTIPEVSAVGETEQSAQEKGLDVVVGRALYKENARGQIQGDLEGITKLVVDANTRELVGVHVIGERASELVHTGLAVMHLQGTVDVFIDMVFNFPTLSESFKYAAYDVLGALAERKTV
jgi:NAD(P) transhydrogenase